MKRPSIWFVLIWALGVLLPLFLSGRAGVVAAQAQEVTDAGVDQAQTPAQLSALLKVHPEKRKTIVPKLEQAIIADVRTQPSTRGRFTIAEIRPRKQRYEGSRPLLLTPLEEGVMPSVTLGAAHNQVFITDSTIFRFRMDGSEMESSGSLSIREDPTLILLLEYRDDSVPPFVHGTSGGVQVKQVTKDDIPRGDGSVHRFIGRVELLGYTFVGEGDDCTRLTFALLKDQGYIYLRGKGRVIGTSGKEVQLGY